jgi:hypothetical protein
MKHAAASILIAMIASTPGGSVEVPVAVEGPALSAFEVLVDGARWRGQLGAGTPAGEEATAVQLVRVASGPPTVMASAVFYAAAGVLARCPAVAVPILPSLGCEPRFEVRPFKTGFDEFLCESSCRPPAQRAER